MAPSSPSSGTVPGSAQWRLLSVLIFLVIATILLAATSVEAEVEVLAAANPQYSSSESDSDVKRKYSDKSRPFIKERKPIKRGKFTVDPKFMETYKKFVHDLIPGKLPDYAGETKRRDGEKVFRTKEMVAAWSPIDCSVLGLKLRNVGVIHKGRRNRVYKMQDRKTHAMYAYKIFENPDEYTAEMGFLVFANHPYFVKPICNHREHKRSQQSADGKTGMMAGLMFEYVPGMSSLQYSRTASQEDLRRISAQLLVAVEYMHWINFVHADLKPENVLIDKNNNIKVIDFGFAIPLPYGKRYRGTATTMAPELHLKVSGEINEAVDWWAYGSTVAIWFGLASKYYRTRTKYVPMRYDDGTFVTQPSPRDFSAQLRQFLYIFFFLDPEERRYNTVRLHEFVRSQPFMRDINFGTFTGALALEDDDLYAMDVLNDTD